MRTRAVILAVACLGTVSSNAHADAWSVAKKVIPGGLSVIVGVDVRASKNTAAELGVHQLMDEFFEGAAEYGKEKCGVDPWDRAGTAVWAFDEHGQGAIFIELRGTTRAEMVTCLETLSGRAVTVDGNDLRFADGEFTLGWIDGVLVVPVDEDDVSSDKEAALLHRMIGGKGAGKDAILIRALRDVDTTAPIWTIYGERTEWGSPQGTEVRRSNPFLLAQEAVGPPEPTGAPAEGVTAEGGSMLMRYGVGEVHLGATTRFLLKANFKYGAADFAVSLRAKIADDSDLQKVFGPNGTVSQSGETVRIETTMDTDTASEFLKDLARAML